jgi:hypothetical protein
MTQLKEIPKMHHPLSSQWDQPRTCDLLVDDYHALMTEETLKQLPNYSASYPTALYEGKMWRSIRPMGIYDEDWLHWVTEDNPVHTKVNIHHRLIILI